MFPMSIKKEEHDKSHNLYKKKDIKFLLSRKQDLIVDNCV